MTDFTRLISCAREDGYAAMTDWTNPVYVSLRIAVMALNSYLYPPTGLKKTYSREKASSHIKSNKKTSSGGNCISAQSLAIWLDDDSYLVRSMEAFGFLGLGHVLEYETLLNSKWVQLLHGFFKWHPSPQWCGVLVQVMAGKHPSTFPLRPDIHSHIFFLEALLFWNMAMVIQPHIITFKSQMTPANLGPLMHTCSFLQAFSGQSMRGL